LGDDAKLIKLAQFGIRESILPDLSTSRAAAVAAVQAF
jgi:hypothetical protein